MGKVLPYSRLAKKQWTLATLVLDIHGCFGAEFQHTQKAKAQRILAGELLVIARERVEAGEAGVIGWEAWCKVNIQRSYREVQRLIAIANKATQEEQEEALERERAAARKGMQAFRDDKRLSSHAEGAAEPAHNSQSVSGTDPVEHLMAQVRRLSQTDRQRFDVAYNKERNHVQNLS